MNSRTDTALEKLLAKLPPFVDRKTSREYLEELVEAIIQEARDA